MHRACVKHLHLRNKCVRAPRKRRSSGSLTAARWSPARSQSRFSQVSLRAPVRTRRELHRDPLAAKRNTALPHYPRPLAPLPNVTTKSVASGWPFPRAPEFASESRFTARCPDCLNLLAPADTRRSMYVVVCECLVHDLLHPSARCYAAVFPLPIARVAPLWAYCSDMSNSNQRRSEPSTLVHVLASHTLITDFALSSGVREPHP